MCWASAKSCLLMPNVNDAKKKLMASQGFTPQVVLIGPGFDP